MDTTMSPAANGVLSAIRYLLVTLGTYLAANGYASAGNNIELAAGAVMIVGPAIWGVYSAVQKYRKVRAVGVQAGINLAVSGRALDANGNMISQFQASDATTPPKPVTLKTAAEIVKSFGPSTQEIAKS